MSKYSQRDFNMLAIPIMSNSPGLMILWIHEAMAYLNWKIKKCWTLT